MFHPLENQINSHFIAHGLDVNEFMSQYITHTYGPGDFYVEDSFTIEIGHDFNFPASKHCFDIGELKSDIFFTHKTFQNIVDYNRSDFCSDIYREFVLTPNMVITINHIPLVVEPMVVEPMVVEPMDIDESSESDS